MDPEAERATLAQEIRSCTKCSLGANGPHLPGSGPTDAKIMLILPGPPLAAAKRGHMLRSKGGRPTQAAETVDAALQEALGVRLQDLYVSSLVRCPLRHGQRSPTRTQLEACRPYLDRELALLQPRLLIASGNVVGRELVPGFRTVSADRGRGLRRLDGSLVIPTYHPDYAQRTRRRTEVAEDLAEAAER